MQSPCPRCGAPTMFWVYDIDSSRADKKSLWCMSCSLEGMPEELEAKARAINDRVRRNSTATRNK